jgi:hypothetical protein
VVAKFLEELLKKAGAALKLAEKVDLSTAALELPVQGLERLT